MTELTNLDFSTPISRYDSIATYEDNIGQGFQIRVSGSEKSIVEERIKNLRIFLDKKNQLESADNDLRISVEFLNTQELEKTHHLNFAFGNDFFERRVETEGLQIITKQPRQVANLQNAFIVGPYRKVEANISLTSGEATFSLWQENSNNSWIEVPDKKVTLSGSSNDQLHHSTNPAKRFMLKVQGRTGTYYTIQGSWVVT